LRGFGCFGGFGGFGGLVISLKALDEYAII
jgi:hypothetical protein